MANWQEHIELNKVITEMSEKYNLDNFEEDCPEEVKKSLASEIRKSKILFHYAKRIEKCKSIAAVNRTLNVIFNAADERLVWCGL